MHKNQPQVVLSKVLASCEGDKKNSGRCFEKKASPAVVEVWQTPSLLVVIRRHLDHDVVLELLSCTPDKATRHLVR